MLKNLKSVSKTISHEWLYANKDVSRDFRNAGNRQITLVKYGKIYFSDKKDFSSEFTFRNCK